MNVVKLQALSNWVLVKEILVTKSLFRTTFNCSAKAYVSFTDDENGEVKFVSVLEEGLNELSFVADGPGKLEIESNGQVMAKLITKGHSVQAMLPEPFTTDFVRKERNPEMEMMMYQMRVNNERMLSQTLRNLEAKAEKRVKDQEGEVIDVQDGKDEKDKVRKPDGSRTGDKDKPVDGSKGKGGLDSGKPSKPDEQGEGAGDDG